MLLNGRTLWSQTNNTHRVLLAIEDITERKRIQDDLIRSNEDLQRFTYVLAYDLRTPVNASLRLLQLFTRRTKGKRNEDEAGMLADSVESIKRLSALTNDLLTWTDAGNAPPQRKLFPLGEPLQIALANLQPHMREAGATIVVSEMPTLLADRTQLAMVFQNLIGNALQYRRKENPHVSVDAVQQGTAWRFSIRDNGQGFKAQYAASIFEPFKRLHGVDVPGSGIGLATCKRTIERLGGRIWADSVPDQGSTFHFTLPA